ncbi:hypothetical protein O4J56_20690 [Nocardiopsis sp. RSe5-2]|uniref:WD40 repeat protein n=1 Tax=Nocardiopsis endophytica TaxID=3018445 RepID=A0ABT4U810_9ACTN|nr:hypothetical protein [Nocardiopsis endophytica]MDA2813076.1 hypothetical protein [Nocardiopsis endophytica]
MRQVLHHARLLAAAGLAVMVAAACSTAADTTGGGGGSGGDEGASGPPTGLALLYRGYDGGDPEQDQALVFLDPESGEEEEAFMLPEGAVDPMAPGIPVWAQFSEDWNYFVYSPPGDQTVQIAQLVENEEGEYVYEPAASLETPPAEVWTDPRIQGDRLWFASRAAEGQASSFQVMSVPMDDPTSSPSQEGTVPFDENGVPSEWAVSPDGDLHVREQAPVQSVAGPAGESLTIRKSGDNVMNATLMADGGQWQHISGAPVWGGGTVIVAPAEERAPAPQTGIQEASPTSGSGAHLIALDDSGTSFKDTPLLIGEGPVRQYMPSESRNATLLQTNDAWYRLELDDDGAPAAEEQELFEVPKDASMTGSPLAVRWT